jgi:EAL domain-containing protein (putative c-di-GMP-specific phosphodiesterase class I)
VNVSPAALTSGLLTSAIGRAADRVVLELTEHRRVEDYDAVIGAVAVLRRRGMRLAVDDAGAGYASLQHILRLEPDIIKLDLGLTRGIETDPARRALAAALVGFAAETNSLIVAEGIETADALRVLQQVGIRCGQGFYLARPGPAEDLSIFDSGSPLILTGKS